MHFERNMFRYMELCVMDFPLLLGKTRGICIHVSDAILLISTVASSLPTVLKPGGSYYLQSEDTYT